MKRKKGKEGRVKQDEKIVRKEEEEEKGSGRKENREREEKGSGRV